jgi:hypothetical protein
MEAPDEWHGPCSDDGTARQMFDSGVHHVVHEPRTPDPEEK